MTKTLAPAKLSITTTKTSLNSTQPRYTSSLLATQRSSTTNTSSSIRNGSARLQNTSRLPAAVHGSAGQPVDSLSSSPLSPSMSNSRTSTTSDSISERSIPSSSISKLASTTNGRSSKIDSVIPGRRSLTATARSKTSTSSSSTILDAPVTSKSRLSAPKVSQFSSTLPKLVATKSVVNQNTSSPRVQTAASAQCDKSSSLKTSNSSCSKIRQLKQPTGIESVNRAISRVTPIIPASKISNRPKGNGLPKPPVCMGGRLNNLVAVVRPQQQQQQPAQQDDKRGEDVPVTRSNATTKACLSSAEVVVVGRQQELEHEAAARLTSVGAPTTIKLKTTQRRGSSGSKREEDHGAKNEAANLNHKDVNSPTEAAAVTALEAKEGLEEGEAIEEATARTTTTSTVNNQNCLTNNLRDQQDEKERPREKDDEGLVSGHEVVCASKECKQDEDGRGESCLGSGEDVSERTTSGCNGQNGPKKIRPDILVSISPSASSSPRPLVTVPTMAISLEPSSSSLLPPPSSVRGNKSTPASETKSLTTKKNDKDGQNGGVPATDSQIASSSAGSSGGGGKLSDIKQHEKRLEQQINKCLSSQHAHTRMPKLQQKQHDDDLANSNKCLHNNKMGKRGSNLQQPPPRSLDSRSAGKHEIGSDSLCSKSTIRSTRAAAASSSATTTNLCGLVSGMDAHSISASHVVSKPMGHRVLSLMMLDAGLVPAGRDQPTNETRKSHVCLQSEPLTLEQPNRLIEFPSHINDLGDNNNNDADLDIEHETSKSNAPSSQMITNRVDANNCIENTNLYLDELALNCGFDQPRNQANCIETSIEQTRAAARLERFSLFGFQSESIVRGASISLPSSPRLPRASQRRAGANDPSQQQRLQPPASDRKFEHLDLDHAQLINERKSYQRATERWYSPVRKCSVTTTTSEPASTKTNLTCDDNNRRLEIHSATSSCSSLNSHCPPMLSLSNQLDAMEFSRMIKANVDRVSRSWAANRDQHQQQNHEIRLVSAAASTIPLEVNDSKTEVFQSRSQLEIRPQPQQSSSPDRTEQIHKLPYQRPLLLCDESDLTCDGSKDNLSSKIDRLDALRRATEKMRASGFNESELESSGNNRSTHQLGLDKECSIGSPPPANTTRQAVSSNADEIKMLDQQSGLLKLEPRPSGRQPRSNSIGGQEFHHLGGEYHSQRLKQQTHALHSRFVDSNQFYNQKVRDYGGSSQYNHNITADRSISPSGLTSGGGRPADFYVPKRSSSIKYPLDKQQPLARNQIHASLECLNTIYSDYGQQNQKQQSLSNHHPRQYTQHLHLQQQQHQQQQPFKHRPSFQSNHYANTYVLSAVPTDTIVNQSAEQDLAAAAMASPQHYQPILSSGGGSISSSKMDGSMSQSPQSHSHYLAQGSFNNRSTVPISHSPLHRRIVPGPMASILNQITSSTSNPLRAGHSSLSLASSTYLIEDKLQNEIKQLQSELKSEKEKNEALSSQLNINSNLMAAFEQSLTTLNSRLRQVTAISERKDRELELLRSQLDSSNRLAVVESSCETSEKSTSPINGPQNGNLDHDAAAVHLSKSHATSQPVDKNGVDDQTGARDEQTLLKIIEDLKRQLIEKDRLLTDTRLEALSAAHQLEQLESRMNGEQSMMANEDDLDEGVMVVNHSPSDSDAITDSAHFGDQHNTLSHRSSHYDHSNHSADHHHHQQSQPMQAHQHKSQKDCNNSLEDMILFTPTQGHKTTSSESRAGGGGGLSGTSSNQSNDDTHEMMHLHRKQRQLDSHSDQSSSDYHDDDKSPGDMTSQQQEFGARNNGTAGQTFEAHDGKTMNKMLDKLLVSN